MSRELDAEVAEKVMGYGSRVKMYASGPIINDAYPVAVAMYTTDPAADYEVLKHVREKWTGEMLREMYQNLVKSWASRTKDEWRIGLWYEPGDYSRSALATIKEKRT